jgi:hypothetical protein
MGATVKSTVENRNHASLLLSSASASQLLIGGAACGMPTIVIHLFVVA